MPTERQHSSAYIQEHTKEKTIKDPNYYTAHCVANKTDKAKEDMKTMTVPFQKNEKITLKESFDRINHLYRLR